MRRSMLMAILTVTVTTFSLTSYAIVAGDFTHFSPTEFTKPLTYEESNIGFEFENDTDHSVWIVVVNKEQSQPIEVKKHSLINEITQANNQQCKITHNITQMNNKQCVVDINEPTKLIVWFENPGDNISIGKKWGLFGATKIEPQPQLVYTFTPGKTIYVTLNDKYKLVPSYAIKESIITETGLSLENNVQDQDIKVDQDNRNRS